MINMVFMRQYGKSLYELAIETYGEDNQKRKAVEELGELSNEILRDLDGRGDRDKIIDEISDVYIMLEQVAIMYGLTTEETGNRVIYKHERLSSKIKEATNGTNKKD